MALEQAALSRRRALLILPRVGVAALCLLESLDDLPREPLGEQ